MSTPSLVGPGLRSVRRILVIHARGGMGDVLLSTPVLDALQRRYAGAAIDMLVRQGAVPMVQHHPAVSDLLVVKEGELDDRAALKRWIKDVKGRKYTLALVLWSKFPEAFLTYRAGIRHRVGQDSRLLYSWMYTRRVSVRSEHGDVKSHWVECQLDFARAVGADLDHPEPRLYVDDSARHGVERVLREVAFPSGAPRVILHVGRGTPLDRRRMPVEPFARIADALARAWGVPVILTGSAAERDVVSGVAESARERVVDLTGRLGVLELGALMEGAAVVVANDSGPMHMAAAVGAPTVGLFAMEKDLPLRWGPCGDGNQIVRPDRFRCKPTCLKETCLRMECYEDVDPQAVVEAAKKAVESHPRHRGHDAGQGCPASCPR